MTGVSLEGVSLEGVFLTGVSMIGVSTTIGVGLMISGDTFLGGMEGRFSSLLPLFALFLFCICYYYIEDESKKKMVYILFGLGVLLIVIEVIYTLVKII